MDDGQSNPNERTNMPEQEPHVVAAIAQVNRDKAAEKHAASERDKREKAEQLEITKAQMEALAQADERQPDRQKVIAYFAAVNAIPFPVCTTEWGQNIAAECRVAVGDLREELMQRLER